MKKYSNEELIKVLAGRNERERNKAFDFIYKELSGLIRSIISKGGGTVDDADEILQEAISSFWEKIVQAKITGDKEMNVLGYITQSCKYLWYHHKKRIGILDDIDEVPEKPVFPYELADYAQEEEAKAIVERLFEKISERCLKLFKHFYFHKWPMSEIADYLGYSNANSAKNQISKCRREARKAAKSLGLM